MSNENKWEDGKAGKLKSRISREIQPYSLLQLIKEYQASKLYQMRHKHIIILSQTEIILQE